MNTVSAGFRVSVVTMLLASLAATVLRAQAPAAAQA
jgi:hypothetical protein